MKRAMTGKVILGKTGIEIKHVIGIKSIVNRMGSESLHGEWIKSGLDAARNCTGCGACLERCPYELPIPELIKANLEWVEDRL